MAGGRPTIFKKEYIEQLNQYFSVEPSFLKEIVTPWKYWDKVEYKEFASNFPSVQGFCASIDIDRGTFYDWLEKWDNDKYTGEDKEDFDKFLHTYNSCKEKQERIWMENALKWLYNPQFSIFIWKNIFKYSDKIETENTNTNLNTDVKTADDIKKMTPKQLDELRKSKLPS